MPEPTDPKGSPEFDLNAWRREIPLTERFIALNNCSHSPRMTQTSAAAASFLDSWDRDGMDWDGWLEEVEAAKRAFARLIGASTEEVAVTTSVSAATASIASTIDPRSSRNRILASEAEFPTVGHVWRAHEKYGIGVDWVPIEDDRIDPARYGAVDERTRVVSATHAYYQNGFKQDLASIAATAHDAGAWLYVDAYQTLGTCPIDVRELEVDMLAGGALKYLLGLPGIAFLYVRAELIETLEPALTGWFGRANPYAFDAKRLDWSGTANRFETGTPPILSAFVARAGIEVIEAVGPAAIERWTRILQQRLIDGGRARGFEIHGTTDVDRKTPSTAFVCPADSHLIEVALRERGVLASARGPVIRLAPHFFNTLDEIDTALDALAEVFAIGRP
ncbi:MAG: aminotransferase class V-fold PLP-dependent enzyme [Gemmatimonadetes bacterium]|nr:aminotransferase class V-fold PLP-dependent enzyme [Gemmatimonadota bacterium]